MTFDNIPLLFFKASGIVFSLVLLIYAFVIFRQTQTMSKTVQGKNNPLIISISFFGILVALAMLFYAIFLI